MEAKVQSEISVDEAFAQAFRSSVGDVPEDKGYSLHIDPSDIPNIGYELTPYGWVQREQPMRKTFVEPDIKEVSAFTAALSPIREKIKMDNESRARSGMPMKAYNENPRLPLPIFEIAGFGLDIKIYADGHVTGLPDDVPGGPQMSIINRIPLTLVKTFAEGRNTVTVEGKE